MKLPYESEEYKVNRDALETVILEVENSGQLNCIQLGAIFGRPFWELLIICMSGSKETTETLVNYLKESR